MTRSKFHETVSRKEKCILIGVATHSENRQEVETNLDELSDLAKTAGAVVVARIIQERPRVDPAFYLGTGKSKEIAERVLNEEIDLLIFDNELSSTQVKNLEQLIQVKVIDRTALILDIFAAHARTREARLQVEMAQLNYYLPRLTRQWSHLSRQVGGIGTKGPGETQLETDRRLIRTRIAHLKHELEKIDNQSRTQRKKSKDLVRVAIIGYTNAGKSTLLNALTNADSRVENKLFATLDTTVRRLNLGAGRMVLVSDTVGFIRKLPATLIASFRTTLSQTIESDILLHIVDISNPHYQEHIDVVREILTDLKIIDKPTILIMNKVDQINDTPVLQEVKAFYPGALFISAKKNIRLDRIKETIIEIIQ
jgi:GTP-binding protein HflX